MYADKKTEGDLPKTGKPPRSLTIIFLAFLLVSVFNLLTQTGVLPFGSLGDVIASLNRAPNLGKIADTLQGTPPLTKDTLDRCIVIDPNVLRNRDELPAGEDPFKTVADLAIDSRSGLLGDNAGGLDQHVVISNSTFTDYTILLAQASLLKMSYVSVTLADGSDETITDAANFIDDAKARGIIPIVSLCNRDVGDSICKIDLKTDKNIVANIFSKISLKANTSSKFVAVIGPDVLSGSTIRGRWGNSIEEMIRRTNTTAANNKIVQNRVINGGNMLVAPGVLSGAYTDVLDKYLGSGGLVASRYDILLAEIFVDYDQYDSYKKTKIDDFAKANDLRVIINSLISAPVDEVKASFGKFCDDDYVQGIIIDDPLNTTGKTTDPLTEEQLENEVLPECSLDVVDDNVDYAWVNCNVDSCLYEDRPVYSERSTASVCGVNDRVRNQVEIKPENGAGLKVICYGEKCQTEKFDTLEIKAPIKAFGSNSVIGTRNRPYVSTCAEAIAYFYEYKDVIDPESTGASSDAIEKISTMVDPLNQFAGEIKIGDRSYAMPWLGSAINCSVAIMASLYDNKLYPDTDIDFYNFHVGSLAPQTALEIKKEDFERKFLTGVYTEEELAEFRNNAKDLRESVIDERALEVNKESIQGTLDLGYNANQIMSLRDYNPLKTSTDYKYPTQDQCPVSNMKYIDELNDYVIGPEIQLTQPEVVWEGTPHTVCYAYGQRDVSNDATDNFAGGIVPSKQVMADDKVVCDIIEPNDPQGPILGTLSIPAYINPKTGQPWIAPNGQAYFTPFDVNNPNSQGSSPVADNYYAEFEKKMDIIRRIEPNPGRWALFDPTYPRTYFNQFGQPNIDIATQNIIFNPAVNGYQLYGGSVYTNAANGFQPFAPSFINFGCYDAYSLINNDPDKPFNNPMAPKNIILDLLNRYGDESGTKAKFDQYMKCTDGRNITTENIQSGTCKYTEQAAQCFEYKYEEDNQDNLYIRTSEYYGNDPSEKLDSLEIPGIYDALYTHYVRLHNDLSGRSRQIVVRENIGWKFDLTVKMRDAGRRLSKEAGDLDYPDYLFTSDYNDPALPGYNQDAAVCTFPDGLGPEVTLEDGQKVAFNDIPLARSRESITDEQYFNWLGYLDIFQEWHVAYTDKDALTSEYERPNKFNDVGAKALGTTVENTVFTKLKRNENLLMSGLASNLNSQPLPTCDEVELAKHKFYEDNKGSLTADEMKQALNDADINCITYYGDRRYKDELGRFLKCELEYDIPWINCDDYLPLCMYDEETNTVGNNTSGGSGGSDNSGGVGKIEVDGNFTCPLINGSCLYGPGTLSHGALVGAIDLVSSVNDVSAPFDGKVTQVKGTSDPNWNVCGTRSINAGGVVWFEGKVGKETVYLRLFHIYVTDANLDKILKGPRGDGSYKVGEIIGRVVTQEDGIPVTGCWGGRHLHIDVVSGRNSKISVANPPVTDLMIAMGCGQGSALSCKPTGNLNIEPDPDQGKEDDTNNATCPAGQTGTCSVSGSCKTGETAVSDKACPMSGVKCCKPKADTSVCGAGFTGTCSVSGSCPSGQTAKSDKACPISGVTCCKEKVGNEVCGSGSNGTCSVSGSCKTGETAKNDKSCPQSGVRCCSVPDDSSSGGDDDSTNIPDGNDLGQCLVDPDEPNANAGLLACDMDMKDTSDNIDWDDLKPIIDSRVQSYNTDTDFINSNPKNNKNSSYTWLAHPTSDDRADVKQKVINLIGESKYAADLAQRREMTNFFVEGAKSRGMNPHFAMSLWIEETAGSAIGSRALGCIYYRGDASRQTGLMPHDGSKASMKAHLNEQLDCLKTYVSEFAEFDQFMCTYAGERDRPNCTKFVVAPNFPRNFCKNYNYEL